MSHIVVISRREMRSVAALAVRLSSDERPGRDAATMLGVTTGVVRRFAAAGADASALGTPCDSLFQVDARSRGAAA
jgi:hypothetical protein